VSSDAFQIDPLHLCDQTFAGQAPCAGSLLPIVEQHHSDPNFFKFAQPGVDLFRKSWGLPKGARNADVRRGAAHQQVCDWHCGGCGIVLPGECKLNDVSGSLDQRRIHLERCSWSHVPSTDVLLPNKTIVEQ